MVYNTTIKNKTKVVFMFGETKNIYVRSHTHANYRLDITVEILEGDKGCVLSWIVTTPQGKNMHMAFKLLDGSWANAYYYLKSEDVINSYNSIVESFKYNVDLLSSDDNNLRQDLLMEGFTKPKNWFDRLCLWFEI